MASGGGYGSSVVSSEANKSLITGRVAAPFPVFYNCHFLAVETAAEQSDLTSVLESLYIILHNMLVILTSNGWSSSLHRRCVV